MGRTVEDLAEPFNGARRIELIGRIRRAQRIERKGAARKKNRTNSTAKTPSAQRAPERAGDLTASSPVAMARPLPKFGGRTIGEDAA